MAGATRGETIDGIAGESTADLGYMQAARAVYYSSEIHFENIEIVHRIYTKLTSS